MRITVDPNTEVSGFGYVEAGKYQLRIVKCEQITGPKAEYLKWEFELVDSNLPSVTGKGKPGHIFENTTLKVGAQFKLRQLTDALGIPWADLDTDAMLGTEFEAQLDIKEYEGIFSNEVKKYIPVK